MPPTCVAMRGSRDASAEINAALPLEILTDQGTGTVLSAEAIAILSLAVVMLQESDAPAGAQTYDEAVSFALAAGVTQATIGALQESVTLALSAGFTRANLVEMMESIAFAAGLDCTFISGGNPGESKICFIFRKRRDHFRT